MGNDKQTFIGLKVSEDLAEQLDQARGDQGRSAWVREAIEEKLPDPGPRVEPYRLERPADFKPGPGMDQQEALAQIGKQMKKASDLGERSGS